MKNNCFFLINNKISITFSIMFNFFFSNTRFIEISYSSLLIYYVYKNFIYSITINYRIFKINYFFNTYPMKNKVN